MGNREAFAEAVDAFAPPAKRKLADEYDAAQARGEVAKDGRPTTVPDGNGLPATSADLGISRKDIHEARMIWRAFWELRHARLRLAIAESSIAWAQDLLIAGDMAPEAALEILDATMNDIAGVRP